MEYKLLRMTRQKNVRILRYVIRCKRIDDLWQQGCAVQDLQQESRCPANIELRLELPVVAPVKKASNYSVAQPHGRDIASQTAAY